MSEVLLIHGACFGAWCWDAVIPELKLKGATARAIDLPGRGAPASLNDQAAAIDAALTGPTVLVGHSAGGFAISAAASSQVLGLIYVAAYVPRPGMSLAQMRRAGPSQPMAGAFEVDRASGLFGFRPGPARELFFHDCEDASRRLCAQAIAPMEQALDKLRGLPSAAIICTEDQAIPPDYQREMASGMEQHEIACGHAPFLAKAAELAGKIAELARGMRAV
jgi:pimeloyl-ACP methyl ester carboxylesterase